MFGKSQFRLGVELGGRRKKNFQGQGKLLIDEFLEEEMLLWLYVCVSLC